MSIFLPGFLVVSAAGIAAMSAALDRGDLDEAARQGALAGPRVVEQALSAPNRTSRLAGIVAAPQTEDAPELLPALASAAGSADRRIAIPAARAARQIARELARHALPDDLAPADLDEWRGAWATLAQDPERFVGVRVVALDTAAALAQAGGDSGMLGFDLGAVLADRDPDVRLVAVTLVPVPVPSPAREVLAKAVADDADPRVALAAANALCGDLATGAGAGSDPAPVLGALGARGLDRIQKLVATQRTHARLAARCIR